MSTNSAKPLYWLSVYEESFHFFLKRLYIYNIVNSQRIKTVLQQSPTLTYESTQFLNTTNLYKYSLSENLRLAHTVKPVLNSGLQSDNLKMLSDSKPRNRIYNDILVCYKDLDFLTLRYLQIVSQVTNSYQLKDQRIQTFVYLNPTNYMVDQSQAVNWAQTY